MSSSVEQIKNKIDIVSLVSSYMKLERSGQNWKGKCPFHNEKTPSFFVSPDRGSYYCFGCQAKGDIFNFVQEFEGLDFVGALKVLADRAGVKLEYHDRNEQGETERLHSVMEKAVFFYQKKLSENPAVLKYLKSRGVENETIKKFRIGYAPDEWRSLSDHLISSGNKKQDLLAAGLVKVPEVSPEKIYDTFRGRIMFPINDSSGRPIAFSGRTLSSDPKIPKYLNSPETILFNKSETLFGLDHAKKSIRIEDFSILVEGQMDLIMLHQIGFSNSVASSGTALTAEHLVKLRRLSNKIVMSFDGDSAGFKAADRSAKIALSLGMDLKLAFLPEGKDPADMALSDPEKLKESIRSAKHIIDFYTDSLLQKGLEPRALGSEIEKNVLPYVARLPSAIERDNFIRSISRKTFIREDALWKDLERVSAIPEGAIENLLFNIVNPSMDFFEVFS
jgi:DNA primase